MSTNSINNFSFDPDKYNVENLNNKSEKEVKEIIINFCNDASNYADHVWDDGELEDDGSLDSKTETNILYNCMKKIDKIFGSSSNAVKQYASKLKSTFVNLANTVLNTRFSGDNITFENGEVTVNKKVSQTEIDAEKAYELYKHYQGQKGDDTIVEDTLKRDEERTKNKLQAQVVAHNAAKKEEEGFLKRYFGIEFNKNRN